MRFHPELPTSGDRLHASLLNGASYLSAREALPWVPGKSLDLGLAGTHSPLGERRGLKTQPAGRDQAAPGPDWNPRQVRMLGVRAGGAGTQEVRREELVHSGCLLPRKPERAGWGGERQAPFSGLGLPRETQGALVL